MTAAIAQDRHIEGLHSIPLALIQPSPENPRKNFEPKPLAELAESIKIHGVRQPVLVRPLKGDKYQLVVGERRWRASKLAGKTEIPAIVDSKLSDSEALEIMVIENLQREDVHPLDEALGYELLMKKAAESDPDLGSLPGSPRHTVDSIAAKVGKSVGYVYARLKLLALTPAAREAFQQNHITAGHAVLIARLQPFDQIKALGACFKNYITGDELARAKKLDLAKAKFADLADVFNLDADDEEHDEFGSGGLRLASEKSLREWIQDNVNLRLKDVPWDLADEKLVPEAGPCSKCEKRSASNPALFAELAVKGEDTCFDAACYGKKREAFVKITLKEEKKRVDSENARRYVDSVGPHDKSGQYLPAEPLRQISEQTAYTAPKADQRVLKAGQWLPAKAKECNSVEDALIVNGENAGQRRLVCCNGACKVHKHHLQKPSEPGATSGAREAGAEEREVRSKIDEKILSAVLSAAAAKIKKPEAKTLRFLATLCVESTNFYIDFPTLCPVLGLKSGLGQQGAQKAIEAHCAKAGAPELLRLLGVFIIGNDLTIYAPELKATAKFAGVDVAKLRKQLEKDAKKESAKAPAKK